MAEVGLAAAQTLFAALNCTELKDICAIWGYESQLKELNKTVTTVKKVLMDAESKVLTNEEQEYINELKDALYEADDLFDEFVTLLELEQLQTSPSKDDEFFQKILQVEYCNQLRRLSRGLEHLTVLKKLELRCNNQLKFLKDEDNEEITTWKPLHQCLHSLTFDNLYNMKNLPKGVQYLTSLQTLQIIRCSRLKGLPEWISCLSSLQSLTIQCCNTIEYLPKGIQTLTSLQSLKIEDCPELEGRCREPDGQDWPKIQHIPNLRIELMQRARWPRLAKKSRHPQPSY